MSENIKKRDRSPKFPYITLTVALERIYTLYQGARGNWVHLSDAADDWGLSPTSSSTLRNAAALLGYGLIEDEGSGIDRRIRLTERAQRIVGDTRPGVREELLAKAALASPIISEYYHKWGRNRPNDQHAVSTLIYDSDFTDRAARTFLNVFDDAITHLSEEKPEAAQSTKATTGVSSDDADSSKRTFSHQGALSRELQAPTVLDSPVADDVTGTVSHSVEWLKANLGNGVSVTVTGSSEMEVKQLKRLIRLLETQAEILQDD